MGQVKVLQVLADHVVHSDIFYLLYKGDIKQEKTRLSSIRYSNMYFNSCIFMFFPEVLFITYITQSVNPESNCFPRSTQGIEVLVGCPVSFSRKCMGRRLPVPLGVHTPKTAVLAGLTAKAELPGIAGKNRFISF